MNGQKAQIYALFSYILGELSLMDEEAAEMQYSNEPDFIEEVQPPSTTTSKNKDVG